MTAIAVRARRIRPSPTWLVAVAWGLAVAIEAMGHGPDHGRVPGTATGLALFAATWQVHVVAVMLPSSLPMLRAFRRVARTGPNPNASQVAFVVGYLAVWTAFGLAAVTGDAVLHALVERTGWLGAHPEVIAGATLLLAGLYQFSDLKDRCLTACRLPSTYLRRHYQRGAAAAARLGVGHGLFCVGCCWALMLVLFGIGTTNVAWMAPFVLVMVLERTWRGGQRLVAAVGAALVAAGVLQVAGGLVPTH